MKTPPMEEGKSKKKALDMLDKSRGAKGLPALHLIHQALRWLPREEEELEEELFELQEELISGLGLSDKEESKGSEGHWPDWRSAVRLLTGVLSRERV